MVFCLTDYNRRPTVYRERNINSTAVAPAVNLLRRGVVVLSGLFLVVLWGLIAYGIVTDERVQRQQALQNGLNLSIAFERHIDASVKTLDVTLQRLREGHTRGMAPFETIAEEVTTGVLEDSLHQVVLARANGDIVYSSIPAIQAKLQPTPINLRERELFRSLASSPASSDELFISKPTQLLVNNTWAMIVARKIFDSQGQFAGLISLAVDPVFFSGFYKSIALGPKGVATLVYDGGIIVARGGADSASTFTGKTIDPEHLLNPPKKEDFWMGPSPVDGLMRWVTYRHHPEYPLAILIALAESDVLGKVRASAQLTILLGALVTLAFVGIACHLLWLDRRLSFARMRVAKHDALHRAALEALEEAVVVITAEGNILSVNPAFERLTGWLSAEVAGQAIGLLQPDLKDLEAPRTLWASLQVPSNWSGETWVRRKDGRQFLGQCCLRNIKNGDDRRPECVLVFSDITQRKHHEQVIWNQANFDALTGLANRMLFYDRLEQTINLAERTKNGFGLLFIDLDEFKAVNDCHGHDAGDHVLGATAERLARCLRTEDTIARLGGDEFTVILRDQANPDTLQALACKLLQALSEPIEFQGLSLSVSASIGIAIYPDHGQTKDQLVNNADAAMYQAKAKGKNQSLVFVPVPGDGVARPVGHHPVSIAIF